MEQQYFIGVNAGSARGQAAIFALKGKRLAFSTRPSQ
ncbi:sugar kinase [Xenorhabdus sp. PB62.4]|nr:sugar kinase [Xenorhabdus sp. PB62.4]